MDDEAQDTARVLGSPEMVEAVQVRPSFTETKRSTPAPLVPAPVAMHNEPLHEDPVIEDAPVGSEACCQPDGSVPPRWGRDPANLDASERTALRTERSVAGGIFDERPFTAVETAEERELLDDTADQSL